MICEYYFGNTRRAVGKSRQVNSSRRPEQAAAEYARTQQLADSLGARNEERGQC